MRVTGYTCQKDWRIIEPTTIGQLIPKKTGGSDNITLTGWFLPTQEQIEDGWKEYWRNYILAEIDKIEILKETFKEPRNGYKGLKDSRYSKILCTTYGLP